MFLFSINEISVNEIASSTMILFGIIDVLGVIPVVIELRERVGHIESEKATIAAMILMVGFLFVGEKLLKIIDVDLNSFAIAGSFVIFAIAMEMILSIRVFKDNDSATGSSIVPLAFPIIAGAGTMTTLLSLKSEYKEINILIAIIINLIFVYVVLKNVKRIELLLGKSGTNVLRKAFGVILLAISIKLFRSNTGL